MKTIIPCSSLMAVLLLTGSVVHAGTTLGTDPLWALDPGVRTYVTTGSTERGIAYNATNDHVLIASRGGGNKVAVLNGADGDELHLLDASGITGGTLALTHVGVDDAGVVYACNLVSPATATPNAPAAFKIYRWANDASGTAMTVAFNGDPSGLSGTNSNSPQRWGDTFAIRGSGLNTQIIVGTSSLATPVSTSGIAFTIFTTTDESNFTATFFATGLETGGCRGITFGEGDTFYSKAAGATKKIRRSSFTLSPPTVTLLQDHTLASELAADSLVPLATQFGTGFKYLATIALNGTTVLGNPEIVRLYDISNPAQVPTLHDKRTLPLNNPNGNLVGAVALGGGRVYCCATNDGIQAYQIIVTPDVVPPSIAGSPAARSVLARGQTTFSVTATGTPPLSYQWYKDDVLMPTAILPTLLVNPVLAASAGAYKCRVTNSANFADSTPATLTVLPSVDSNVLTELWHLTPTARPYLGAADARGLDYNPVNQHVYVVSRTPAPAIRVLDATNGADVGTLDLTNVVGGNFPINMVSVADDGAIYACNLSNITDGSSFKVYRWADDQPTTTPSTIYDGNPFDTDGGGPNVGTRLGDTLDVRGSGANTQILAGARNTNNFAVLSTGDGANFVLTAFTPPLVAPASFGLGVAFGEGNTAWGKSNGTGLINVAFDLNEATSSLISLFPLASLPGTQAAIAVDPSVGALMAISLENSDNVQIFDLPVPYPIVPPPTLTLLDQEFFATDIVNDNGTGAITLKAGKAFALNSNNGIVAYTVVKSLPVPPAQAEITEVTFNANTGEITFKLKGELGATYRIDRSPDMSAGSWVALGTELLTVQGLSITRPAPPVAGKVFFRAVKQ